MYSEDIKHTFDSAASKQFFAITVKLIGNNYLLWDQSFRFFINLQKKLKYLTKDPLAKGITSYDDWVASDVV